MTSSNLGSTEVSGVESVAFVGPPTALVSLAIGDRAMQLLGQLVVELGVDHRALTGLFVDDVAPEPLQETVHADDVARLPRARGVERAHGHLVQTQGVRAVGVVHLVGRDGVIRQVYRGPASESRLVHDIEAALAEKS